MQKLKNLKQVVKIIGNILKHLFLYLFYKRKRTHFADKKVNEVYKIAICSMVTYDNEGLYIDSKTSNAAKAKACSQIISALLTLAATEAASDGVSKYTLNDGQVVITAEKRGVNSIMASIKGFENLRKYYIAQVNGRMTRLVDSKNFTGNGRFR